MRTLDNWLKKLNLKRQIIFADRSESYSHTFDAQKLLMQKKDITALAMYVTTPVKLELAETSQKTEPHEENDPGSRYATG